MKACKTQCSACPFRSTSLKGWLGNYKGPGAIFSSLWKGEPFFCHMRADYEREDWLEVLMKDGELCLGALIAVGVKDSYFPKPTDPQIQVAMRKAIEAYEQNPERFDVMPMRDFREHHEESWRKVFAD